MSLFVLKERKLKVWSSLLILCLVAVSPCSAKMPKEQKEYYEGVYKDTWNYLSSHVEERTGLPYDSSARQPATSLTNAGLYLASLAVAQRTGLLDKTEALKRSEIVLSSIEKIETWRGIPRPWFLIRTLNPTHGDEFTYAPHLANFLGGLIVAEAVFPELSGRIEAMIERMELKTLYDARTGWLPGGYNVKTKNFAIYQAWGHWYYKYFASETRLLSFYLIASGAVPPSHWISLIRPVLDKEGEKFYQSGPEDGGLFAQYLAGLFLDERYSPAGDSQKRFASYQMKYARKIKSPVWGWSSCETPYGRYLGYGELRDDIVTPYASILASIYYPEEAYKNLKELEKMGARPGKGFGFLDSVNWKTQEVSKNYLTPSQTMVFLSLANLLHDGVVWKAFGENGTVQKGIQLLKGDL